ncbi:hypothetical protein, partial [Klebsiella aerogenes]|uniref:hypothetical protein n=1 Tax=Klebsiella aerogenes TaxID=548 RepID=UPI0036A87AFA
FDLIHSPFPVGRYTDCLVCLKDKRQKRLIMTQLNLSGYTVLEWRCSKKVKNCIAAGCFLELASQLSNCPFVMLEFPVYTYTKRIIQEIRSWPAEA